MQYNQQKGKQNNKEGRKTTPANRVRCSNAILEDNGNNINECRSSLASLVTNTTDIEKCSKFIYKVREDRFFKVRERQVNKFTRLDSKSNNNSFSHNNRAIDKNQAQVSDISKNTNSGKNKAQQGNNKKWVIDLSKIPPTKGQKSRADINSLLRREQVPKPNLSKQENIRLAQLKNDKDRVVLTANKGVAMVVMDKEDYIQKAVLLLV